MDDFTRKFDAAQDKDEQIHFILTSVYEALKEKGYDPINQIVGYILSEDVSIAVTMNIIPIGMIAFAWNTIFISASAPNPIKLGTAIHAAFLICSKLTTQE